MDRRCSPRILIVFKIIIFIYIKSYLYYLKAILYKLHNKQILQAFLPKERFVSLHVCFYEIRTGSRTYQNTSQRTPLVLQLKMENI